MEKTKEVEKGSGQFFCLEGGPKFVKTRLVKGANSTFRGGYSWKREKFNEGAWLWSLGGMGWSLRME